jgi:hypothetical protein
MARNKYNLDRHIPADVAREVRRRSKFGCVICRCAFCQYEHIDPPFADARSHDPDAICLLCGACHHKVTSGRLSKQKVLSKYLEIQQSIDPGRPRELLDLSTSPVEICLGSTRFERPRTLLRINDREMLCIKSPSDGSSSPSLEGLFCDSTGKEIFRISDNVWEGPLDAWDITVKGRRTTIRMERSRVALVFDVRPPRSISISKLDMYMDDCHVRLEEDHVLIGRLFHGHWFYVGLNNFSCIGADTGISINSRSASPPQLSEIRMVGGKGIALEGTGISLGCGAASMVIDRLRVWIP